MKRFSLIPLLTLWFVTVACCIHPLYAQLSPGDLHKSHADLEGLKNCTQCHDVGKQISPSKCLSCHTILRERIENNQGFHANPEFRRCESCHVEHHGRDFDLIYWEEGQENFNHEKSGFKLEGKHAELDCRSCHKPSHIQDQGLFREKKKDLQRTFLGLNPDCLSCHRDEHRGQLSTNCTTCHLMDGWKPAQKFDHNQAGFRLTGKHTQVACEKCHTGIVDKRYPDDNAYVKFTGIQFAQCMDCHRDPHENRFGRDCTKCHNTSGWERIDQASFNHDLTSFPLKGRHAFLECEKCHTPGKPFKGLEFARCLDCHSDFHQGQFASRASGGDCDECHTVEGFTPSTFTIDDHRQTDFQLTGAHLAIACIACHEPSQTQSGSKTIPFKFSTTDCQTCHSDPHRGDVERFVSRDGCTHCHNTQSWKRITFDHSQTDFVLIGRHQQVDCRSCHEPVQTQGAGMQLRFSGLSVSCQSCHTDIHRGQFSQTTVQAGATQRVTDCSGCHTPTGWKPAKFDHNKDSRFRLEGAHQLVSCSNCHHTTEEDGTKFVRYKPINPACSTCHGGTQMPEERMR